MIWIRKELIKNFIKYPISRKSRTFVKNYFKEKRLELPKIKLFMTLLVKDEEEIIETNIRFHHAMGVDGFIVTSHNSKDNTVKILRKLQAEGIVLEIIEQTETKYLQSKWVAEMINLARDKYKANWVINADADEFYYSRQLDLKQSIQENSSANVLFVDSITYYTENTQDYINSPYFKPRLLKDFEADYLGIENEYIKQYIVGEFSCPKVIHKTDGFINITMGNHDINIENKKKIHCADIRLYHYHIRSYKAWEEKIKRYLETAPLTEPGECIHMKKMIEIYKNNNLKNEFEKRYNKNVRNMLLDKGILIKDYSISNFIKYKNITRKYIN